MIWANCLQVSDRLFFFLACISMSRLDLPKFVSISSCGPPLCMATTTTAFPMERQFTDRPIPNYSAAPQVIGLASVITRSTTRISRCDQIANVRAEALIPAGFISIVRRNIVNSDTCPFARCSTAFEDPLPNVRQNKAQGAQSRPQLFG